MITKSRRLRKTRIRAKVSGSAERPRLSVFRSNKKIYVQLIDDVKGKTLAAASGTDAKAVGEAIAKAADSKRKRINYLIWQHKIITHQTQKALSKPLYRLTEFPKRQKVETPCALMH